MSPLFLPALFAGMLIFAAGLTVRRRSKLDGLLLMSGGAVGLMHALTWQTGLLHHDGGNAFGALIGLALGPLALCVLGLFFGLRFFFTPIRGWPRGMYLVGGLAALSPLIFIAMIALMFIAAGVR